MKNIIKLTEMDLARIVKRVINEGMRDDSNEEPDYVKVYHMYKNGDVSQKTFYGYMGMLEKHERQALIDYIESEKEMHHFMNEEDDHEEREIRTRKMVRDMEGKTKSNRKEYTGKGRQSPPPPQFKR